jgi:Holliday junction resolvasome RuvABC endonuclease subunit
MRVAGIDYSLTSPAICAFKGTEFNLRDCRFSFLSFEQKYEVSDFRFKSFIMEKGLSYPERYDFISNWVIYFLKTNKVKIAFLEDYSYGSKGKVFHIAENGGVLKDKLWKAGIEYHLIAPTVIKKHATGKGTANKQLMEERFIKDNPDFNIREYLNMPEKSFNPSSDVIDSYYICKYGAYYLDDEII